VTATLAPDRVRRVALYVAIVLGTAAVALWANGTLSSDVYFLLACGSFVLEHGTGATRVEPYGTLNAGREWLDQQWGTQVVFRLLYDAVGMRGLQLAYGLLLGLAALPVIVGCRERRPAQALGCLLLFLPTLIGVLDARAAGFSFACFALLVILVDGEHRGWRVWLIPLLFLVWAQLHAAFAAGLLFLVLVGVGQAIDARRGLRSGSPWRLLLFGAALPMVFLTPLGTALLRYVAILGRDPVLPRITYEWQSTLDHPALLLYVAAAGAFCVWVWHDQEPPRRLEPLVVTIGFCLFALTATRQVVWLGLIAFYVVRSCGRPGSITLPHRVALPALAGAAAAVVLWLAVWAPTPPEPQVMTTVAAYAVTHPPGPGRIATPPGTGSYLLYRGGANAPLIDGRLENYTPAEIDGTYAVLRGEEAAVDHAVRDWNVVAIITRDRTGIRELPRQGFRVVFRNREGAYLVRGG
jgi:hypothetical protein